MSGAQLKILAALQHHGRLNGKQIGDETQLYPGSMYSALYRLEDDGLIASEWIEGPSPHRRAYWITMAGQKAGDAAIRKLDPDD
jgi:DNA-binding PadR family transcriptional regulator